MNTHISVRREDDEQDPGGIDERHGPDEEDPPPPPSLPQDPPSGEPPRTPVAALRARLVRHVGLPDAAVGMLIVAVVVRAMGVRWPPTIPYLTPETDSAMLCTFAAGFDHPGRFARDAILGDQSNYDFYATVQVPWTRMLESLTGDYSIALYAAMPALLFFQLLGFYILGRVLYENRFAAVLLAGSCLFQIKIKGLSTYWGISTWTTARDWFQAFLPFVLALALSSRGRPRRFLAVMVGAGTLIYLHPVSTPGWALAIWCGLWFNFPSTWPFFRRFRWMFVCGLVFLATASPFIVKYLLAHESGGGVDDVELIRTIIRYRFLPDYSNPANAAVRIVRQLFDTGLPWVALVGGVAVHALGEDARRRRGHVLTWTVLILVFAFLIPILEHDWAVEAGRIPFEYDLIRNGRYLYLVCYLLGLWPLAIVANRGQQMWAIGFGSLFFIIQLLTFTTPALHLKANSIAVRFDKWKVPPPDAEDENEEKAWEPAERKFDIHDARAEAMLWIRDHTPESIALLGQHPHDCLYLRYVARRSVRHCWKDGGVLIYSDFDRLQQWYRWAGKMRGFGKRSGQGALPGLVTAAAALDADHLFLTGAIDSNVAQEAGVTPIFTNQVFTVVRIDRARRADLSSPEKPSPR
ncbi:MAG: hypothetical protein AAGN82_02560 [Myxococcota bacterium]